MDGFVLLIEGGFIIVFPDREVVMTFSDLPPDIQQLSAQEIENWINANVRELEEILLQVIVVSVDPFVVEVRPITAPEADPPAPSSGG